LSAIPAKKYKLVSTWALATEPVSIAHLWARRALIWEAADPYLYFRTTPDNRIIVGGEDADFTDPDRRDALIPGKAKRILDKLARLLPDTPLTAEYLWAGTFAESPTGLPVIGELPGLPNVFAILGSGGNGITFSTIASDIAADWVAGRRHALTPVFAP
jgi:glycine/D-amino acid oxidase-like deaminating enzyme